MGDLKPLGSEKLHGDDKLKRILELTYYNENKTNKPNNKSNYITESVNSVYGIVKEKDGYYVKKGLNESSLDYIGGLFMKNKNRFSSYAEALKRLELLKGQDLQEATKYVLKQSKPADTSAPMPADAPSEEPMPPADDMGDAPPAEDMGDIPPSDEMDAPPPVDDMGGDEGPMDDPQITGGDSQKETEPSKRSDYMNEIQRSAGKLGQSLRDVKEKLESDDIKYVINMILSAIDMKKLDKEDRDDIADRFNIQDEEVPVDDEGGDLEAVAADSEGGDEVDIDETMKKLESFINAPSVHSEDIAYGEYSDIVPDRNVDEQEDYDIDSAYEDKTYLPDDENGHENGDDFGYDGEEEDDIVQLDLDEIKAEINRNVNQTLSKYFK